MVQTLLALNDKIHSAVSSVYIFIFSLKVFKLTLRFKENVRAKCFTYIAK